MLLEVMPLVGLGSLRLGMPQTQVREAFAEWGKPHYLCLGGLWSWDTPAGTSITAHSWDWVLESIHLEFSEWPPYELDRVQCRGVDLFARPYREVVAGLNRQTPVVEVAANWFEAPEIGLSLGSADGAYPLGTFFECAVIGTREDPE